MANAATIDIKGNNKPLSKDLQESENLITSFGNKMVAVFAAIGAAIAAKRTFDFAVGLGKSFLDAASAQEDAAAKLDAVLNATGHAAGFTIEQMSALATEMQATTKYGDETVLSMQAVLASFRNVRGDNFILATKAIADMSTVMGTDLNSAALQVGKALNDPLQGMMALTRAGVTFTDSQKEQINVLLKSGDVMGAQKIILDELNNEFGGAAEAVGNTFGGQMEKMKNRFGDIAESLGFALMPAVEAFFPLIDAVATFTENSVPYFKLGVDFLIAGAKLILTQLQPVWEGLVTASISAFTMIQVGIEDFTLITQRSMLGWQLGFLQVFAEVQHWIGTVIPDLLSWFADNWANIFTDLTTFQATVFTNMFANFGKFIDGIKALLSGDLSGGPMIWSALTEGFEMTLKELPKIAKRVVSEEEQAALDAFAMIDAKIVGDFASKFAKNRAAFDGFFNDMLTKQKQVTDLTDTADKKFNPDDFKTKDDEKEKEDKAKKDKDKKDKEDAAKKDKEDKGAEFVALEDLNKRIQAAAAKAQEERLQKEKEAKKEEEDNLTAVEKENLFGGKGFEAKKKDIKSSEPDLILKSNTELLLDQMKQTDEEMVKSLEKSKDDFAATFNDFTDTFSAMVDNALKPNEKTPEERVLEELKKQNALMEESNTLTAGQKAAQETLVQQTDKLIIELPDIGKLF